MVQYLFEQTEIGIKLHGNWWCSIPDRAAFADSSGAITTIQTHVQGSQLLREWALPCLQIHMSVPSTIIPIWFARTHLLLLSQID